MSGRNSFDVAAEDIARSFYAVFMQYTTPNYDWMLAFATGGGTGSWEEASEERRDLLVAVMRRLLEAEKIAPGRNTIVAGEKP